MNTPASRIPAGWSEVRLGDLVKEGDTINYGIVQPGDDYPGGIPIVRVADFSDTSIDTRNLKRVHPNIESQYVRSRLQGDELLVSCVGSIGKVAIAHKSLRNANIARAVARISCKSEVDKKYLMWFISSPSPQRYFRSETRTVSQPTLNIEQIKNTPILLPPFAEQKRIAAILDKADAIRRMRRESVSVAEELLRSTFLEMFGDPVTNPKGWPVDSLLNLCHSTTYGTAVKTNENGRGIICLRMNNITYDGLVDLNDIKWVELESREMAELRLKDGDVLFNRTNSIELVGKTAVWHKAIDCSFAGYLIRLRLNERRGVGDYVAGAMNARSMKTVLMQMAKPSINMANISASDLSRIRLPVPPVDSQVRYIEVVRKIEFLRERAIQSASEAEKILQSLLHRAFRGELTSSESETVPRQLSIFPGESRRS